MTAPPLLRVDGLMKSFHGNRVVDGASFDVPAGRIVALLGENGAGKSTVIKMLAGVYQRDAGRIILNGEQVTGVGAPPGVSFIHQDLALVEWMTVAENIALVTGFPGGRRAISWRAVRRQAERTLALVGGGIHPDDRVFDLPRTERALLAIARGLVGGSRLLVLDEPTASLPAADVRRLFAVLDRLRATGVGMIYVSHRLDEIFEIADDVVVMRNGRVVGAGPTAGFSPAALVRLIVGRQTRSTCVGTPGEQVRLELDAVQVGDVGPVDLRVRAGEVVGLVGLRGAGQEEVGRAVAGVLPVREGRMRLDGRAFTPRHAAMAVRAGVGFVTSSRESDGVASRLSVRENLFLNPAVWGRRGYLPGRVRSERSRAAALIAEFGVRPPDPEAPIETLSGGNQQKVIVARWFGVGRVVAVLEEPTMGVDVGAKADIYALLRQAGDRGTAALIVSTDLEEVAAELGIPVVGWHAGPDSGPIPSAGLFTNVTTDPLEVSWLAAAYAVHESGGTAGVAILTDSQYQIAIRKADAMRDYIELCDTCQVLSYQDAPIAEADSRMPALISSLVQQHDDRLTHLLGINGNYFGGAKGSLRDAGRSPAGPPASVAAGDGDAAEFQRIRTVDYQAATVAEPMVLQGWQLVDELNRALAGEQPSGFVPFPALITKANVPDGDVFDPPSGYRDIYRAVWEGQ